MKTEQIENAKPKRYERNEIDYDAVRKQLAEAAKEFHGYHEWTQKEDELLREFYGHVDSKILMSKLRVSRNQLYRRVEQLKLDKISRKSSSPNGRK